MSLKILSSKPVKKYAEAKPLLLTARQLKSPPKSVLIVNLKAEGAMPDVLHGTGHPIVNASVKKTLGQKASFLEVELRDAAGKRMKEKYFLLRAKAHINCLAWKKMNLTWSGRQFSSPLASFDRLVLIPGNVDSRTQLFSPECAPGVIVVRDQLAKKLNGFSGIRFLRGNDFSWSISPPSKKELDEKAVLMKLAVQSGEKYAKEVGRDYSDLEELADDCWFHMGHVDFEVKGITIPDAWASEVSAAFRKAFIQAVEKRSK
jgi:hypothetical protein